jgi:hypothetical protein
MDESDMEKKRTFTEPSPQLKLGWQVTPAGQPRYWLRTNAQPGHQQDSDLVQVRPQDMTAHSVIIAQSGSGKSFFLGRLIEELTLMTKARCVILDPNADFLRIGEINGQIWESVGYNSDLDLGRLPTESSMSDFVSLWALISKSILTTRKELFNAGEPGQVTKYRHVRLGWLSLPVEYIIDELTSAQSLELYYCHEIARLVYNLIEIGSAITQAANAVSVPWEMSKDPWIASFSAIRTFYSEWRKMAIASDTSTDAAEFLLAHTALTKSLQATTMHGGVRREIEQNEELKEMLKYTESSNQWSIITNINLLAKQASIMTIYAPEDTIALYLGCYERFLQSGIAELQEPSKLLDDERLTVIDLPSLSDKRSRLLVINSVLDEIWQRARADWATALNRSADLDKRVPIFVVIDEAHNLAAIDPREPLEKLVREQLRSIAAEGRKYGLFLILVSQRPDKLDSLILSECDNKALMKIGSQRVLNESERLLGLDDIPRRLLERCLEFNKGRCLIVGQWTNNEPRLLYSAARRTVEGGRSLRDEYWAVPDSQVVAASQDDAN